MQPRNIEWVIKNIRRATHPKAALRSIDYHVWLDTPQGKGQPSRRDVPVCSAGPGSQERCCWNGLDDTQVLVVVDDPLEGPLLWDLAEVWAHHRIRDALLASCMFCFCSTAHAREADSPRNTCKGYCMRQQPKPCSIPPPAMQDTTVSVIGAPSTVRPP